MSITDELRKWISTVAWLDDSVSHSHKDILAIADRIDAEHEKAMSRAGQLLADAEKDRDYNYANWQECKQKVLQGNITFSELNARIEHLMDELSHCIELPKDADGEYINIGDVMETFACPAQDYRKLVVYALAERDVMSTENEFFAFNEIRHHHAPTVEEVLREMLYKAHIYDRREMELLPDLIADYAKRLTLAEGEDA